MLRQERSSSFTMATASAMENGIHGTESWEFSALVQKMSSLSKWVSSYAYNNSSVEMLQLLSRNLVSCL